MVDAVLAQINVKSDLFHTFMDVLSEENSYLGNLIQQYYCKCHVHGTKIQGPQAHCEAMCCVMNIVAKWLRPTATEWRSPVIAC